MVTVRVVEGKFMVGTDSSGHSIAIGRDPDDETRLIGSKASDLLLISAAACSTYDVSGILAKQREPFTAITVTCSGDQLPEPPWTFTRIHLKYVIRGNVSAEKVARAIQLSEDKYCSVISTLRLGIPVTSEFEIVAEG